MIRLSRLSDYAIVLMCEIATSIDDVYSARKLHDKTNISQSAIMKVLKLLANADLVSSVRGANGGYIVTKEPCEISVLDIVKAIDGPVSVTLCSHGSKETCVFESSCKAKYGWNLVNQGLNDTLSKFTVADFMSAHAFNHHTNIGVENVLST
jgi:FeS assembly SUF system regulator